THTRACVRKPAGFPCSSRFNPRMDPTMSAAPRRKAVCSVPPIIKTKDEARIRKLKDNNHVQSGGELIAVAGVVEWSGSVQGAIKAQLGTNRQAGKGLRHRRLDIQADGDGPVSSAASANGAGIDRKSVV